MPDDYTMIGNKRITGLALIVVLLFVGGVTAATLFYYNAPSNAKSNPTSQQATSSPVPSLSASSLQPSLQPTSPPTSAALTAQPTLPTPTMHTTAPTSTPVVSATPYPSPIPSASNLVTVLRGQCKAQVSGVQWNKSYNIRYPAYTGSGALSSVTQTSDGGYMLFGGVDTMFPSFGGGGPLLVKTDSSGNVLWSKCFLNSGADSIVQAADGGCFLVGLTNLLKIDSLGNVQWNETVSDSLSSLKWISSFLESSDGGYTFLGSESYGGQEALTLMIKLDASGSLLWNRQYACAIGRLIQTNDGGYAMIGRSSFYAGEYPWIMKTNSFGQVLWNQTFWQSGVTQANGTRPPVHVGPLIQTSDGGFAVLGHTNYSGEGYPWVAKLNSNGVMVWNQTYSQCPGQIMDTPSLIQARDGGYAFIVDIGIGWSRTCVLVKTDSLGNMQWNLTNGPSVTGWLVIQTSDGGYAFIGNNVTSSENNPSWLLKVEPR